jgi:soluble lytic murein transglycosylase-like protein
LPLAIAGCTSTGLTPAHSTAALADTANKGEEQQATVAAIDAATAESPALAYSASAGAATGIDPLIVHYAQAYNVPESLVRRVIVRESRYNPAARNGPYWGLMQIRHDTARSMGYRGDAAGLLNAETNLRYAVKYLRGAWLCADGNADRAVRLYASGYYYVAKHKGLLRAVGLKS